MNEVVLAGCQSVPLAGYLKSLGVLKAITGKYPRARAFWRSNQFVICGPFDYPAVVDYLLSEYEPAPVVAPWNAGSGFYFQERKAQEKDPATGKKQKLGVFDQETAATKAMAAILTSQNRRLKAYGAVLQVAIGAVREAGYKTAPKDNEKAAFIQRLRATLPESALHAVDACVVITSKGGDLTPEWPPLLGSGGNDGNLDFTSNYMRRIADAIGNAGATSPISRAWLDHSLKGEATPNLPKSKLGQFAPGQAGGPNSSEGYDAESLANPWDFILMIEGALLFAGASVRRHSVEQGGAFSFPFTVRPASAGSGSLGPADVSRGELWAPMWRQPAMLVELRSLLSEGRVALGKRPARDSLDFVRAAHQLGSYRGIDAYQRYAFLKRNGDAHFAAPLSRVELSARAGFSAAGDLDRAGWLDRLRQFARDKDTARRFCTLCRQLEDHLFDIAGQQPSPAQAQALLSLLAEVEAALASSTKARPEVRPVPMLSGDWVQAADDESAEFRIAKALAGLMGVGDQPLPLRAQLFPVARQGADWVMPSNAGSVRVHLGRKGRLADVLGALLAQRLQLWPRLGMEDKPLASPAGATLDDVAAFLQDDRMDARIAALLPGLSLCRIPLDTDRSAGAGALPAAFGLMKLALLPDATLRRLGRLGEGEHLPVPTGMLAALRAGDHGHRAVGLACRRLRASGLVPRMDATEPMLTGVSPARAAAALLIPLSWGACAALTRRLLDDTADAAATID